MKRLWSLILVLALLAGFCVLSVSCGKDGEDGKEDQEKNNYYSDAKKPDLDLVEISDYVTLGEYKGMTVKVAGVDHEEESVWFRVLDNAEIIAFPEGLVEYYESQIIAIYEYYAKEKDITLDEALEAHGMSKDEISEEAKETACEDLVLAAIIEAEEIELTDEEIDRLFDKYVEEYTAIGYTEYYIRNNLREIILEIMLRDKVMEFLLLNNTLDYGTEE